ncbi:MAG: ORF6N domain-containing protein [Elusimicrobia bacterium]|nr:ORF6N domain-containing protein [Elusimicrobiota bacterium]
MKNLITQNQIESKIFLIRSSKVMLDRDLAKLYGVQTGQLTRQVRRNIERFPSDFMFQLTKNEFNDLKCQIGISSWGGTRKLPYVFTQEGVAMLSSVLNSKRAIQVNIQIVRVFIKLREIVSTNKEILNKLTQLENKYEKHDKQIYAIFEQIREFLTFKEKPKKQIGFSPDKSLKHPQNKKTVIKKRKVVFTKSFDITRI